MYIYMFLKSFLGFENWRTQAQHADVITLLRTLAQFGLDLSDRTTMTSLSLKLSSGRYKTLLSRQYPVGGSSIEGRLLDLLPSGIQHFLIILNVTVLFYLISFV